MYIQIACWTERKNRDQKAAMFMENIRLIVYKVSWQKNCKYDNNSGT